MMWALTWVPSPRMNFPSVKAARSQAMLAVTMGDRGNARAMAVPRVRSGAALPASASAMNGS